jgi:hypothetical protein
MGMANTNQIYARLTGVGVVATTNYAAGIAWEYEINSKTDWFLPSRYELNELCKYARTQITGNTATLCDTSGTIRSGFSTDEYWSSSESAGTNAWFQNFSTGGQNSRPKTYNTLRVRPVRAFG